MQIMMACHMNILYPSMADGCAVCGAPGRVCSGCRDVFYCGREHQTADWARHKANCKPFKRSVDPKTGQKTLLVANRAIPAGTVVMRSKPLVVGPSGLQTCCLGCLRGLTELAGSTRRCSGCGLPVCSKKCEEESPHRVECGLLKRAGFRAGRPLFSSIMSCHLEWSTLALAVKVLRTLVRSDDEKKKVLSQKTRLLLALSIPNTGKTLRDAADMIETKMKMKQFTTEEVLQIAEVWRMNQSTFSCQDGRAICGLHTGDYNMLTNTCTPNCAMSNDDPRDASLVTVVAKRPIAAGETLTVMRTSLESGTYVRKLDGRQVFFECDCTRCLDPTELGLYMSSICCKKCRDGGVKSMMVCCNTKDEYYLESPWKCEKCGYTMSYVEYFHFVNDTRMALHVLEHDANEIRHFIGEQMWPKGLLHRTHEFVVRANLLLRNLAKDELHTLVDVSRDLLEVVEKLDPWDSDTIEVLRSNLAEAVMASIQFDLSLGKITPKKAEAMSLREAHKLNESMKVLAMPGLKEQKDDLVHQLGTVIPLAASMIKGPCVVCGAPGFTCPLCESSEALYCTTGHRHRDWDRHKAECQRLAPTPEINNNELKDCHLKLLNDSVHGAHVGAAKKISNHELILERQPLVVGPSFVCSAGPSPTLCLGCHDSVNFSTVRQCSSCGFPLCRKKCEKMSHHTAECSALKRVKYFLSRDNLETWKQEPLVYAFRICVLRCALQLKNGKAGIPNIPALDIFLKTDEGKQIQDATTWIQKGLKLQNILSSEAILRAGSICQRQCIPVGEPVVKKVVAIYPHAEHVLHSCVPNALCIGTGDDEEDESFSSVVFAQRDIPAEEPITLPYVSLALGTYSRRLLLEHFDGCYCSRCLHETELGLYVGNVCCEQCKGAAENAPKMISVNTTDILTENWVCEQCEFTLSKVTMQELHADIFDKLRALKGESAELYQQFIDANLSPKGVLHPTHEAIIEAKREIVLKDMELQTRLPQEISSRNMSYCEDLMRFYAKVQPSSELLKQFQMILMRYVITSNVPENQV